MSAAFAALAFAALACAAAPSAPSVPAVPSPAPSPAPSPTVTEESPAMTTALRVSLTPNTTTELTALDGRVELTRLTAASSFAAGFEAAATPAFGTLTFTRGDETITRAFEQRRAFEVWGHQAAVYGDRAETLVIAPPGEMPSPE